MARHFKTAATSPRHFKAGVLDHLAPAAGDVVTGHKTWDPHGADGTLDMGLYVLISGVAAATDVRNGTPRYTGGGNGSCYVPAAGDVQSGVNVDATTGTFASPAVGKVINDTSWGAGGVEFTGTYAAPVQAGYSALAAGYGAGGATTGTLAASKIRDATYGTLGDSSVLVAAGGTYVDPANSGVWHDVAIGVSPRVGTKVGSSITNLSAGNVKLDVAIDDVTGTYGGGGIVIVDD